MALQINVKSTVHFAFTVQMVVVEYNHHPQVIVLRQLIQFQPITLFRFAFAVDDELDPMALL